MSMASIAALPRATNTLRSVNRVNRCIDRPLRGNTAVLGACQQNPLAAARPKPHARQQRHSRTNAMYGECEECRGLARHRRRSCYRWPL